MKTLSILTIAAALGFSLASGAQAQEYAAVISPSNVVATSPSLNDFTALTERHAQRIGGQNSEAWEGAGIGGNPNGN